LRLRPPVGRDTVELAYTTTTTEREDHMTRVFAASVTAILLAVSVAAQAPAPARTPTSRPDPKTGKDAAGTQLPTFDVVTGCVKPGPPPERVVPGAAAMTYVLEGATGSMTGTVKIEGLAPPGTNLATLVNKKIEISGLNMKERPSPTISMRVVKEVAPTC
jgi:hypothetical protein